MFEIGLGRRFGTLLQHKQVFLDLFYIEFGGDFSKMQGYGGNVSGIAFKC